MKHLTIDEILDFVSIADLSRESVTLAAMVNGHTRKCEKCRKNVCAFQLIYDKFTEYSAQGNFKDFVSQHLAGIGKEIENQPDELDAFR